MTPSPFRAAGLLSALALAPPSAGGAQTATRAPTMSPTMQMSGQMSGSGDTRQAPCPATPAPLPAKLAGWNTAGPITAATGLAGLASAAIVPGRGVTASLSPVAAVSYPVASGHAGEPGTSGGLLAFTAAQAGTYRVALGAGAWIDMVRDGSVVASTAHGHGPACGPIRKTVDFTLAPGRYVLQVAGNKTPTLALMIARVPG